MLDPQIETILGLIKTSGLPEVWQLTPDQAATLANWVLTLK